MLSARLEGAEKPSNDQFFSTVLLLALTKMIDRSFKIDFETFKKGWLKMFEGKSEDRWQQSFEQVPGREVD